MLGSVWLGSALLGSALLGSALPALLDSDLIVATGGGERGWCPSVSCFILVCWACAEHFGGIAQGFKLQGLLQVPKQVAVQLPHFPLCAAIFRRTVVEMCPGRQPHRNC